MEYRHPQETTRRVQPSGCDLTGKVKKSICIITGLGDDGHSYQFACAVRASLKSEHSESNYFIVTLCSHLLPAVDAPCVRRYRWRICQRDASTWKKVSISSGQKTAPGGFGLFTVENRNGQFLDVRSELNKQDTELTAYFVSWEGELQTLHFYLDRRSKQFTPDENEKEKINKSLVRPIGAPVVNHSCRVVGLLTAELNINYFSGPWSPGAQSVVVLEPSSPTFSPLTLSRSYLES